MSLRTLGVLIGIAFQADRWGALLLCLSVPANFLSLTMGALATKALRDASTGADHQIVVAGVLAAAAVVLYVGSMLVSIYVIHALSLKIDALVDRRIAEMVTRLPGIEHYERPEYLDEVQLLRQQASAVGAGRNAIVQLVAQVVQVVVVGGLLAARTPWLLALTVFALPSFVCSNSRIASTAGRRRLRLSRSESCTD
ncbi:MAG TPA: hypothetical protein VIL34_06835 [Actinopolymorphaceae bacterium]